MFQIYFTFEKELRMDAYVKSELEKKLLEYYELFENHKKPYTLNDINALIERHNYTFNEVRPLIKVKKFINLSGCGTGASDIVLSQLFSKVDIEYISFDTKHTYSELVADYLKGVSAFTREYIDLSERHQTAYQKYFIDGSTNVILFTEIFEHLDISTIHRILEDLKNLCGNKLLYITTPNLHYWRNIIKQLMNIEIFDGGDCEAYKKSDYGHIHLFTSGQLKQIIESHGFECEIKYITWPKQLGKYYFSAVSRLNPRLCNELINIVARL